MALHPFTSRGIGDGKVHHVSACCNIGMLGVAAVAGGAVAEVPGVGGSGIDIDQHGVGPEQRGEPQTSGTAGEIRSRGRLHIHTPGKGIRAAVEVGHDKGDHEGATIGIDMRGVLKGARIERSRGGITEIPQPAGDLAASILVAGILENGCLVLAVAPVVEMSDRRTRHRDGSTVKISAVPAVGDE